MHEPVMKLEVTEMLVKDPDGYYIDATCGDTGHSQAICKKLSPKGRLLMVDKDPIAITMALKVFANTPQAHVYHGSYAELKTIVTTLGWCGKVHGVLFDLGVSSRQLDTPDRGFSFNHAGSLDMRFDNSHGETVAAWLAHASAKEIAQVLIDYGNEPYAQKIAATIVSGRKKAPIKTTDQLARLVSKIRPPLRKRLHPATLTFQAFRIHINNELEAFDMTLKQLPELLIAAGRLVVLTFQSLEAKLLKHYVSNRKKLPTGTVQLRPVAKYFPSAEEIKNNPRSRSAVLRVMEKVVA